MRIAPPRAPRATAENVIPMINVVFLLLVFFLITARIAPPLPVEIDAPQAQGQETEADPDALVVAPDGTLHYGGATGQAALDLLAERSGDSPLLLRADKGMEAVRLAGVLRQVAEIAPTRIEMVVEE